MIDSTNESRAALYLEMAKKMGEAAERAADTQVAATYLELAGKWIRLAEATRRHGDNDDLPGREGDEERLSPAGASSEHHA